uniref:Uncharacterized protein n=1 Tax=Anopheles quadriannulatus TaxID=34691 RepID=A0A182XSY8_ANOQN
MHNTREADSRGTGTTKKVLHSTMLSVGSCWQQQGNNQVVENSQLVVVRTRVVCVRQYQFCEPGRCVWWQMDTFRFRG